MRPRFSNGSRVTVNPYTTVIQARNLIDFGGFKFGSTVFDFRPGQQSSNTCKFLGIEWEDARMDFHSVELFGCELLGGHFDGPLGSNMRLRAPPGIVSVVTGVGATLQCTQTQLAPFGANLNGVILKGGAGAGVAQFDNFGGAESFNGIIGVVVRGTLSPGIRLGGSSSNDPGWCVLNNLRRIDLESAIVGADLYGVKTAIRNWSSNGLPTRLFDARRHTFLEFEGGALIGTTNGVCIRALNDTYILGLESASGTFDNSATPGDNVLIGSDPTPVSFAALPRTDISFNLDNNQLCRVS